jgi:hypothetical protein
MRVKQGAAMHFHLREGCRRLVRCVQSSRAWVRLQVARAIKYFPACSEKKASHAYNRSSGRHILPGSWFGAV